MPEYEKDRGNIHTNLGILLLNLGNHEEALKEFQVAHNIFTRLRAAYPNVADYLHGQAVPCFQRGILLSGLRKLSEALKEYEQARDLLAKRVKLYPGIPEYLDELSSTHNNMGLVLKGLGKPEQALKEYEEARDLQLKLVSARPGVTAYQDRLGHMRNDLGLTLTGLRKREEARNEYQHAIDIRARLVRAHPEVPEYQVNLAGTCCNIGALIRGGGKPLESLDYLRRAVELLQAVRRRQPANPTARLYLRHSHVARAQALDLLGRHREAAEDWDQARLLDRGPSRNYVLRRHALSLALAGDHAGAVRRARQLEVTAGLNPLDVYDLACVYAVSARVATGEASRPLPERDKRAEQYARAAVALLRRVAAAQALSNPASIAYLDADKHLSFLRDRDDYRQFRAGLAAAK